MNTLTLPQHAMRAPPSAAPPTAGFWQSGHRPTLIAAFLYFDVAFMVWVILGPLAPIISQDLGLDAAQEGLMVAVPTLAGAVLRIVNGFLGDAIGPKRTGAINQVIVILGLAAAWRLWCHQLLRHSGRRRDPWVCKRQLRGALPRTVWRAA